MIVYFLCVFDEIYFIAKFAGRLEVMNGITDN